MENGTTNQMPATHTSETLPNTTGLSVTEGVPNTSKTSHMPNGTTGSANVQDANVQVENKTDAQGDVTQPANPSTVDTAKYGKVDSDSANNKEQLRRRVMQRESDLTKALGDMEGQTGNEERRSALQGALDAGRDVLKTGWEHVGEMEAAQLSRWLETSEPLILQGIPAQSTQAAETADNNKPATTSTAVDQPAVKA